MSARALGLLTILATLGLSSPAAAAICPGPPPHECSENHPIASFKATGDGFVGHEQTFTSESQANPDRTIAREEWDFDDNGIYDAAGHQVTHSFAGARTYDVHLRVTDSAGATTEIRSPIRIVDPPPESLTIEATPAVTTTDIKATVIKGRVVPARSGSVIVIFEPFPYTARTTTDHVQIAPDGTFEYRFEPVVNTRVRAAVEWSGAEGGYNRLESQPIFVWHDWIPSIYKRIRHGMTEVYFQPDPATAADAMKNQRIWLYWGRRKAHTFRRVGSTRFRSAPGVTGLFAFRRLRIPHPRKSDIVFVCIRETRDDGFGPPQPESAVCGRRRLTL